MNVSVSLHSFLDQPSYYFVVQYDFVFLFIVAHYVCMRSVNTSNIYQKYSYFAEFQRILSFSELTTNVLKGKDKQ
jgi:hypothetical protein